MSNYLDLFRGTTKNTYKRPLEDEEETPTPLLDLFKNKKTKIQTKSNVDVSETDNYVDRSAYKYPEKPELESYRKSETLAPEDYYKTRGTYSPQDRKTQEKSILGFKTTLPSDEIMAKQVEAKKVSDAKAKQDKALAEDRLKQIDDEMKVIRNKNIRMEPEDRKSYDNLRVERLQVQSVAKPVLRGIFDAATGKVGKVLGVEDTKDLATRDINLT